MTDPEKLARSEQAKRLLNDPLLIEIFAKKEQQIVQAFKDCPVRDLEGMRLLQSELRMISMARDSLLGWLDEGKLLAHDAREKESALKQVFSRFR